MGYETELTELSGPSGKTFRVYEDVNGDVQVELNGTYTTAGNSVVTANINPLTGRIRNSAGGTDIPPAKIYGGGLGITAAKRLGYALMAKTLGGIYLGFETNFGGAFGRYLIEYTGDVLGGNPTRNITAIDAQALLDTAGVALGSNTSIPFVHALSTGACLFVLYEATAGKYYLFRTNTTRTDCGTGAAPTNNRALMQIGEKAAVHPAGIRALHSRSFCECVIDDNTTVLKRKVLFAEYNVAAGRVDGGTNDQVRVWQSDDDGVTWTVLIEFNGDGTNHHIDHFHFVKQDPNSGLIYFGAGDGHNSSPTNFDERFLLCWDGLSAAPAANTAPSAYNSAAGWKYISRGELTRWGDVGFAPTHIYGLADCDLEAADTASTGHANCIADKMLNWVSAYPNTELVDNIAPILTCDDGVNRYWLTFNGGAAERALYIYASGDDGRTWRKCATFSLYKTGIVMPHTFLYDSAENKFIISGVYGLGGIQFVSSAKATAEGTGITGGSWVFSVGTSQTDVVTLDENS